MDLRLGFAPAPDGARGGAPSDERQTRYWARARDAVRMAVALWIMASKCGNV